MVANVDNRLAELEAWFGQWESALVAYSGGVDSALAMTVAHRALGERALACIAVSPSFPEREKRDALALADQLGLAIREIGTDELNDPRYRENNRSRCYFCKSEMYGQMRSLAQREGWQVLIDGTNEDDLGDDRPGQYAGREQKVRSPLVELGLTKDEVRALAKHLDLPVWDKPAMACLASRVPRGTPVTPELLKQIEQAEDVLVGLGFVQYRVRHHGPIARIEVGEEELDKAIAQRGAIIHGIQAAGYEHVCLDLGGYQTGSMNNAIQVSVKGT
jgi:uncharacterized protein